MNRFIGTISQEGVTDGPDGGDSSRSAFDYGESYEAMEELFTQHDQSLSQDNCVDSEDYDDLEPVSKQICQNEDVHFDEFLDDELEAELGELDMDAIIADAEEKSRSPTQKRPAAPSNSSKNVDTFHIGEDLETETKSFSTNKRRQTLFESATTTTITNKRKRKSTGSSTTTAQTNTLTSHFSTIKRQNSNTLYAPATSIKNGMVEIRLPGKLGTITAKPGDVWLAREKKYREKSFAFTLGEISIENQNYVAEIAAAWMKLEMAFLGSDEAANVKKCTGKDWVLVKKHELLPEDNKIQLNKQLLERLQHNLPDETSCLCYEMDGKINHSFYYETKEPTQISNLNTRPSAIDLFAGGGGTSIGLKKTGFDVKYKVEMNKTACDTLNMNFPDSHVFCEDIANFLNSCQTQRVGVYPKRSQSDYIHGSPPCQGFSAVNTGGGANDQQNNECTFKFLEVMTYFQPSFVSMENVPGLVQDRNIDYLLRIVGGLLSMSYQVRTSIVNSKDFGDPQNRARVIILASKKGYKLPKLKPTHGEGTHNDVVTAGDVLHDLEHVNPALGGLVNLPGEGHVTDYFKEGTELSDKCDNHYVLIANRPANTVRKQNQIRHYSQNRYITVRERARLQGFPDSYKFAGTRKEMFDQMGNAVPVGLATAIGRSVVESYRLGLYS